MERLDIALGLIPLLAEFVPTHFGIEQIRFAGRALSSRRLRARRRMLRILGHIL